MLFKNDSIIVKVGGYYGERGYVMLNNFVFLMYYSIMGNGSFCLICMRLKEKIIWDIEFLILVIYGDKNFMEIFDDNSI